MSRLALRTLLAAAIVLVAACAGRSDPTVGAPNAFSPVPAQSQRNPHQVWPFEFKNFTESTLGMHRFRENCMKWNVPDRKNITPGQTVKAEVNTNAGCCRCSHETSWFTEKFYAENGDYRDVHFELPVGSNEWQVSNGETKGDLYFCDKSLPGVGIKGTIIRGTKCR